MPTPTPSIRTLGLTVPVADILDAGKWRRNYAFGISLGQGDPPAETSTLNALLGCDSTKGRAKTAGGRAVQDAVDAILTQIPDDVIRWHLRAALSELETKLGIPMGVVVVKGTPVDEGLVKGIDYDKEEPRRPWVGVDRENFYRIDLPPGVISVERVRAFWWGQPVWSISAADRNAELIQLEHPGTSSLHLVAVSGVTLMVTMPGLATAGYGALQMIAGYPGRLPAVWAVDYTMAPVGKYGQVGEIEAVLAHWCYCKAGILLLSIAGQAQGRGVSNASLSIDGLSKSIGLTNSVMYGLNSALEIRMKEAEEAIDWRAMRLYKQGLRVRSY